MSKTAFGRLARTLLTDEVQKTVEGSRHIFVTQFSRVSVNALSELRKNLRNTEAKFLVVKNTLGRRVISASSAKELASLIEGQCGIAVTDADVGKLSKIFMTFTVENTGFQVKGASINGELFTADMVKTLSRLPSREELLAQVAAGFKSPITGMVGVLRQVLGNFLNVLNQIQKTKEK